MSLHFPCPCNIAHGQNPVLLSVIAEPELLHMSPSWSPCHRLRSGTNCRPRGGRCFKPWIVLPLCFLAGSLACNSKNFSDILWPHLKTIPSRLRYYSSELIGRFTFEWTWGRTQYPERTGRGLLTNPGLCHLTVLPPPMKGFLRSQLKPADMPIPHSYFAPSQYLPLYRMVKRLWGNEIQAPRHWTVHALPVTPKNTFQIAVYSLIISLILILDNPWDKNKFCLKYSCFSGLETGKCSRNYTFGWCDSKFIEITLFLPWKLRF